MTLTITHAFVSGIADDPVAAAAGEVVPSNWNADHALVGDLSGYTITVSQISDATIASGASVSGTNTGDQNLSAYATLASPTFTGTVSGITAAMVGAPSGSGTSSGTNTGDQTNISGNAATVTTNANLTGPIASSGNATSITSQTGTGTTFVMQASPSLTTPNINVATGTGLILTGTSANIFSVGANGSTNPVVQIDASVSSQADGISIQGGAAGAGTIISSISSSATSSLKIQSKGTANLSLFTGSSSATLNLGLNSNARIGITDSKVMFTPAASGIAAGARFSFAAIGGDSNLTVSTEAPLIYFNGGVTRGHATGTLTLQRDFRITGSTHGFAGASTATDVAALSIDGYGQAGTNATFTNAHAILIPTQAIAGTVVNAYGINVVAPTGATTLNQAALFTGDVGLTSGNLLINTAGKGISIKSGSNARIGTGTLSGGTATISNSSVTANTRVFLQDTTSGGLTNVGVLTAVTTAGTGFVVTSTIALDTSTFNWFLVESA